MKRQPHFLRTVPLDSLKAKRLTVISLFSGCGGMDLGMMQAGFEVRVMIDNDKTCCETLRMNFGSAVPGKCSQKRPPAILCRDLTRLPTADILKAADLQVGESGVVTGGFPCQGFSIAGKRLLTDPRNKLYKVCVRVVREALPHYFIFENVPGLISMAKGAVIHGICREFACCGYDVTWKKLNAADYGVPQNRWRVFFVGKRNDALVFTAGRENPVLILGTSGRYKHPDTFTKKYGFPSHWPEPKEASA